MLTIGGLLKDCWRVVGLFVGSFVLLEFICVESCVFDIAFMRLLKVSFFWCSITV